MKAAVVLCFTALIGLSMMANIDPHPRGCIYVNGDCMEDCPVGTTSYTTGCGYVTPEATCDNPHPVENSSDEICDYTACYCDAPTVRDTKTNTCVKFEDCPKKEQNSS